ncbi:3-oxoadipate enol-lactonase [Nocardioides salarius]|uniref:3-oxoadipate enol-lactonase n=1 Tax=Nocardioides salarius TaxID=374513 RepID=A0ABS2MA13_9ACTN|nr:alpha/beta fold hydrolase [Nocardioides salarius]MBM7508039.1 3-oxoadipate enol-lactonase [Nocardioides salarius]
MNPLLLLHPLGSDSSFWSSCAHLLARPLLVPDLPGHGSAELPDVRAGVPGLAAAVHEWLDGEVTSPVVVVGISLGGLVAQQLAVQHPERVAGLVLVDTVAAYPAPMRASWLERAAAARSDGLEVLADAMQDMWFGEDTRREHADLVAAARRRFVTTDPEGYARTCEVLRDADTTALLSQITVPTLVVCGDADAPPFVQAAPALAAGVRDGELQWLPGARHASVLEKPHAFAEMVQGFLERRGL